MINNIQILRFIAALWVAFYHAKAPVVFGHLMPELPRWLTAIQKAGFVGVDIFFVISGVIMALTTRAASPSIKTGLRFLLIRYARIYTGWWPFFFIYLMAFFWRGPLGEKELVGSFFLFPMGLQKYILPIVWTLSFELYFYTILGLLLPFARRVQVAALAVAAAFMIIFVIWSSQQGFYTPDRFHETWPVHQFVLLPLIGEFLAGFLLCEWVHRYKPTRVWPWLVGAIVLFACAVYYQKFIVGGDSGLEGYYYSPWRALLLGGFASCLVCAALIGKPWFGTTGKAMSRLGDASYAIYLSHIVILAGMSHLYMRMGWPISLKAPGYFIMIVTIVVYSYLHFRWIERPIYGIARKYIDDLFGTASTGGKIQSV